MTRAALLLALLTTGCAHGLRVNGGPLLRAGACRSLDVAMRWTDGTTSPLRLTVCVP